MPTPTALVLPPGVVAMIPTAEGPGELAATSDAIWVENHGDSFLSRIDPVQNVETQRLDKVHTHCDVAAGAGFVWATEASSSSISKVDSVTGQFQGARGAGAGL